MSSTVLRYALVSSFIAIGGLGFAIAQTISVNNASCPGATVTYGAGTIAINTAGCGTTATAPTILGTPPGGNVGTAYSYTFTASGSPAPTISLVAGGAYPTGLNLSASGVLSGTPSLAGVYTFAVQAANAGGTAFSPATGTHNVTITNLPVINSAAPPVATPGISYSHAFTIPASQPAATWTSSISLPAWLNLNPSTGLLSGLPGSGDAGQIIFTVTATNANGAATQNVTLNVVAPTAPTINGAPTSGIVGTSYSYGFTVTGSPAPTISVVSGGTLPTGLNLAPTTGVLSGIPTVAGTYTFAVQAMNSVSTVVSPPSGTHSVVIAAPATGGATLSIEGAVIPNPSKEPSIFGPVHNGLNGAGMRSNAWAVNQDRCNSPAAPNNAPNLTRLWLHNINFDIYSHSFSSDIFELTPGQALTYRFVPNELGVGRFSLGETTVGTMAPTFMTLSTSPCDFDYTKVTVKDYCYRTATRDNTVYFEVTNGTPASPLYCKLVPGNTYYFNVRFQNAAVPAGGGVATDSCSSAKCAATFQIVR